MWALGDYASVAELIDDVARDHLFAAMPVSAGDRLLDVATGTGNAALHAARRGAEVTGLDLVPELLEVAARRARHGVLASNGSSTMPRRCRFRTGSSTT